MDINKPVRLLTVWPMQRLGSHDWLYRSTLSTGYLKIIKDLQYVKIITGNTSIKHSQCIFLPLYDQTNSFPSCSLPYESCLLSSIDNKMVKHLEQKMGLVDFIL